MKEPGTDRRSGRISRRPGVRGCEYTLRPHPEELAKQASRRTDTTHGLAAILRDARKSALLRMRSEICFTTRKRATQYSEASVIESKSCDVLDPAPSRSMTVLRGATCP